jgi:hypothetical protein
LVGSSLQGCALVTFGLVSNVWIATTALCLNRLFSTGMSSWNSQNYLEVRTIARSYSNKNIGIALPLI